jgi:hypothetical protein
MDMILTIDLMDGVFRFQSIVLGVFMRWFAALCLLLPFDLAQPAQADPPKEKGPAGVLYFYEPKPGQRKAHEEAYQKHLEWHRRHNDPLDWYAWRVESGAHFGDFVDGSLGNLWPAFDARILPEEDGADFAATAGPLARMTGMMFVELLPEASHWESRAQAPNLDVYRVEAIPGMEPHLEAFLAKVSTGMPGRRGWFRVVSGGPAPSYLLLLPRKASDDLAQGPSYWRGLAARPEARLDQWIKGINSETWSFLPGCTLLGKP